MAKKINFPKIQDLSIEQIYDWMERGLDAQQLPEEIVDYLDAMDKVRAMRNRFDKWGSKDAILDYLVKIEGYSRYLATKLYNHTVEFFYVDPTASKQALLNDIFQKMEKNLHMAISFAKDTSDSAKIQKMLIDMANIVKEIYPDTDDDGSDYISRPIKLYTQKPEDVGLPPQNRKEISKMIDKFPELHEVVLQKIKEEAGVLPMKLFLDESEDPRER